MAHLLIYLFPALLDITLGAALYVNVQRMADSGASATATTLVFAILYITYTIACLLVGRFVKPGNAVKMIVMAGITSAVCSMAFILIPDLNALYVLMPCLALTMALFFVPFQVFMKAVAQGKSQTITHATAMYTIAWSTGIAIGPFFSGWVWDLSGKWQYCFYINVIISLAVSVGILLFRHHARTEQSSHENLEEATPSDMRLYKKMPDYAWLGWVITAAGGGTLGIIASLFPKSALDIPIPKAYIGTILALIHASRAIMAIFFLKGRSPWMYRHTPLAIFGLFGIVGTVGFAYSPTVTWFFFAAVCYGIFSAAFFFYLVFHAVVHPAKSARYIAINEAVVGIGSFVAPVAGGMIADKYGHKTAYMSAAAILTAALILQFITHFSKRQHVKDLYLAKQ